MHQGSENVIRPYGLGNYTIVQTIFDRGIYEMVKDGILPPFDKQIWQRSFYDHVIRNRDDYNEIYEYIYENPMKWQFDQLYAEE